MLHFATLISAGLRSHGRYAAFGPILSIPAWLHPYFRMYKSRVIPRTVPLEIQIEKLREFQPTVIHTNPSVLRSLIHNVDYPLRELIQPRMVLLGGETLNEELKTQFEAELDAEFFNIYGAIELGRLACECSRHEGLHFNADHFVLEILDGEGPASPGSPGVVVVTSLYAFAMPFIRYRPGDICAFTDKRCSCGSPLPLIHGPLGREEDIVKLSSGKMLSPRRFDHFIRGYSNVAKWQVLQESYDRFVVKLVLDGPADNEMFDRIRASFLEYLREPVHLDIQIAGSVGEGALRNANSSRGCRPRRSNGAPLGGHGSIIRAQPPGLAHKPSIWFGSG